MPVEPSSRPAQDPLMVSTELKKIMAETQHETTFTMIKPDAAVYDNVVYAINNRFVKEGFSILEVRKIRLTRKIATELYRIHQEKVWFSELLDYVTSDICLIFALNKINAIQDLRRLVGPTDPSIARTSDPESLRALYGKTKQNNSVHCSDSLESALRELEIFFPCHTFHAETKSSSTSMSKTQADTTVPLSESQTATTTTTIVSTTTTTETESGSSVVS